MSTMTIVEFERIGRQHNPPPIHVDGVLSGDEIADAVHHHARKRLASRWFGVVVCADGTGVIEGGRFGRFTWVVTDPTA